MTDNQNNSFDHTSEKDKHYFGGFFNLAVNNIEQVEKQFEERLNQKNSSYFSKKISLSDFERGVNMLRQYFPMVRYLCKFIDSNKSNQENRTEDFKVLYTSLTETIKSLRDYYTHYYHVPIKIGEKNEDIIPFIEDTLKSVAIYVKENKVKTDKTKEALKKSLQKELEELKDLKQKELKEGNCENKKSTKKDIEHELYDDAFTHILSKKGEGEGQKTCLNEHCKALLPKGAQREQNNLSKYGLIFLLSMFLSRKEYEDLTAQIKGFKAKNIRPKDSLKSYTKENSLKYMATHWVFSHLCYKGLKHTLNTTFSKETFLTEMIDELNKVPAEVYHLLCPEKQAQFILDWNEYVRDDGEKEKNAANMTVVHPVIRKRYEDKFNYFAVRYLDHFANFPTLKFSVTVGNYIHDQRTKTIGSTKRISTRVIKQKINLFAKLADVVAVKNEYFKQNHNHAVANEQQPDTGEGWELFPNPHYQFLNGNIPIYVDLKNLKRQQETREPITSLSKKRKYEIKKILTDALLGSGKKLKLSQPVALLSCNELPALLYEHLVKNKTGEDLETIIIEKIKQQITNISHYEQGTHPLAKNQMSRNLIKSNDNEQIDYKKLTNALENEIGKTTQKLNFIEQKQNESSKKHLFTAREIGEEARWLADDLKRFMPSAARKSWKGYQHSELKKQLALYNLYRNEAQELLAQNWQLTRRHKIERNLKKIFDNTKIDSFEKLYEKYLNIRKNYLNGLKRRFNDSANYKPEIQKKVHEECFRIFTKRRYTLSSTDIQKERLLCKPICLPRGIFDEKPTYIEGATVKEEAERFAEWYVYCYKEHNYQSFYSLERSYKKSFEAYHKERETLHGKEKTITEEMRLLYFKKSMDRKIKNVKSKDLFIKIMVDNLFQKIFKTKFDYDLKDLYQTPEEIDKIRTEAHTQSKKEKGDQSEPVRNTIGLYNKTIPEYTILEGAVTCSDVKIKDIGKYRKIEQDERVKTILSYQVKEKKLTIEQIQEELASYEEVRRHSLLKKVQELEEHVLKKFPANGDRHPKELELDGNPNFTKYITCGVLQHLLPEEEAKQVQENFKGYINCTVLKNLQSEKAATEEKRVDRERTIAPSDLVQKGFILITLRNKFAHNELPCKNFLQFITARYPKNTKESYAKYFTRVFSEIVVTFKNEKNMT